MKASSIGMYAIMWLLFHPLILLLLAGVVAGVVLALIAQALLRRAYRNKAPVELAAGRSRLCWLPKYCAWVQLHASIRSCPSPNNALTMAMSRLGFEEFESSLRELKFSRGGQTQAPISTIHRAALLVRFELPLEPLVRMTVEYAPRSYILLDTGDLWKLTAEVKQLLEEQGIEDAGAEPGDNDPIDPDNPYRSPRSPGV